MIDTIHIKIIDDAGEAVAVEKLAPPVYVYTQPRNGKIVRCVKPLAQGVMDATGANIYQLHGKETIDRAVGTAVEITTAEYDELLATLGTTPGGEEENQPAEPETPEDGGSEVMTAAELTAAVNQLVADQAALVTAIEKGLTL